MKALHGSGGSTKGIGIYGVYKTIIKEMGYKPDLMSGISISALLALPVALGKWNELDELFFNFDLDTFFNKRPINKKGSIRLNAILRFLFGKSLGEQYNLYDILSCLVSEEDYFYYVNNNNLPIIIIMAVDVITGSRVFVNLKDLTYDQYLKYSMASASIPLYVPSVNIKGKTLYDGGLRNHIISHWCMEKFPITESISVYSRPKEHYFNILENKKLSNTQLVSRVSEIMSIEISKSDEFEENTIANQKGIKNHQVFLPRVLTSLYDTDRNRLNKLYELSCFEARKLIF